MRMNVTNEFIFVLKANARKQEENERSIAEEKVATKKRNNHKDFTT